MFWYNQTSTPLTLAECAWVIIFQLLLYLQKIMHIWVILETGTPQVVCSTPLIFLYKMENMFDHKPNELLYPLDGKGCIHATLTKCISIKYSIYSLVMYLIIYNLPCTGYVPDYLQSSLYSLVMSQLIYISFIFSRSVI